MLPEVNGLYKKNDIDELYMRPHTFRKEINIFEEYA